MQHPRRRRMHAWILIRRPLRGSYDELYSSLRLSHFPGRNGADMSPKYRRPYDPTHRIAASSSTAYVRMLHGCVRAQYDPCRGHSSSGSRSQVTHSALSADLFGSPPLHFFHLPGNRRSWPTRMFPIQRWRRPLRASSPASSPGASMQRRLIESASARPCERT